MSKAIAAFGEVDELWESKWQLALSLFKDWSQSTLVSVPRYGVNSEVCVL